MLQVRLSHRFPQFELRASFSGPARGIAALFGPSGCGKTTVVNAIAGFLRADAGHIELAGDVLYDSDAGLDIPLGHRRIGYVSQQPKLFPHMTVEANLLYGFRRSDHRNRRIRPDHIIQLLGLHPLLARRPGRLSGGERQRVDLGRALLSQPRLLLLDEPLAALDAERKAEILPYIERLRDDLGLPMVYVSHAIEEVSRLADVIVLMEQGRTVAVGPAIDVMASLETGLQSNDYETGALIQAKVVGHDDHYALTRLGFADGELLVPRIAMAVGQTLRARIRARDIMLAVTEPCGISALNILPAHVTAIRSLDASHADVQLSTGAAVLRARLTRQSVARLQLAPGSPVFAVIKSVALDRGSLGLHSSRA